MTSMRMDRRSLLGLVGAGAGAALLGACSSSGGSKSGSGNKTVRWWHLQTTDPGKSLYASFAQQFMAAHPGVKIEVTPIQNDSFKTKLSTNIQAGDPPDLFHSWGGGVLAQQVDAGMVKDITTDVAAWQSTLIPRALDPYTINGKVYASATDTGMVGVWYNKDLFTKAGIGTVPTTWTEYLDVVRKLKAAKITPIALDGKDKWPGHYWWAYLALRIAGVPGVQAAAQAKDFTGPDFVAAGARLKELVDLQPFQTGWLAAGYDTTDGEAATMGNGKAAMELMGQWAPTVQKSSSQGLKGLGDKEGFFPFPTVDGGKGQINDAFGGGGGIAVGKNAPPAAIDFLKFLAQPEQQRAYVKAAGVPPVVAAAQDAVTDPNLVLVTQQLAKATAFQLYLDQAYAPALGEQVKDSVALLMAGKATPDQVAKAITNAAKQN